MVPDLLDFMELVTWARGMSTLILSHPSVHMISLCVSEVCLKFKDTTDFPQTLSSTTLEF